MDIKTFASLQTTLTYFILHKENDNKTKNLNCKDDETEIGPMEVDAGIQLIRGGTQFLKISLRE